MSSNCGDEYMEISRVIALLPYADQLDSYADAAAGGLKESLRRLLSSSTYASHRYQFPALIHKYIEHFGMRLTKKEVVDLIKFGLSLFYCPQVDKLTREKWGNLLYLLILFFTISSVQEIWDFEKAHIYTALGSGSYDKIFLPLQIFTPTESKHFEEIKRVWLDEIFYIWYQYPAPSMHIEVVNFLATFSHHFPGRVDMEPHFDRIFNFLVAYFFNSTNDDNILRSSAVIIANSIVPDSNVLKLLRNLFHVCKHACHITSNNSKRVHFLQFCYEIVNAVAARLRRELHWIPELKGHITDIVEWAKLTREQVDEFVDIVLPSCLEVNIYMHCGSRELRTACNAVRELAYLRPRLVVPRLVESIEEGFLTPQLPMRVSRPLKALACSVICLVSPRVFPFWAHYIGNQPTDQPHNYPMADTTVKMQTPEQRKHITSHLSAMIYPEGRALVPRILNVCLAALDVNHSDRLQCSIRTLDGIFKTMPIKDLSEMVQTETESIEDNESLRGEILKNFSPQELSRASSGVEDIVVDIYKRILHIMESENENAHFRIAANETEQNTDQSTSICSQLSTLGSFIAISASAVPRLRVRLVRACLDAILQNQWSPTNSRSLSKMLLWLLSGPRGDSEAIMGHSDSDIALFALNEFWSHFNCLYNELKGENCLTHNGKVEPRFLSLISILKVFFFAFIPSRLEEVKNDFIYPAVEVLFDLLNVSLGSGEELPPSKDLADYASDCLSGLLYRLLTFSVDFSNVDFYNNAGYASDPMWTPFVNYRKAHEVVKWLRPSEETYTLAEYVLRKFLLPLLNRLSTVSDELNTYLGEGSPNEKSIPQIPCTSGQSQMAYQQTHLISLTTWISNIGSSILEGLKPRSISHEDMKYVNEICTQLELMRHEVVASPMSSNAVKDIKLDIPFFDLPSDEDGSGLRDQIFRIGLRFLDVIAKLSIKFDAHAVDPTAQSTGQSVIGNIHSVEHLRDLMNVIGSAGFNYMDHNPEQETLHFSLHPQSPIIGYYDGFFLNYLEPENNFAGFYGPSRELLSALADGERPSLKCGGGGLYGKSYLPITWIMCARRQHFNFARRALGLFAAWPGSESSSLISFPRLPANREIIHYVETCINIALNCYKKSAQKLALDAYIMSVDETPGVHALFARLFMGIMRPFYTGEVHASSYALYRARSYRLKRVIWVLHELVAKTTFLNELYNNDPILWSEAWLAIAKLGFYTAVSPTKDSNNLTATQIRERYNEQAEIARMCVAAPTVLGKHSFTLYFHTSYDPDSHPTNAPLRYLILSAQKLLKTLGGCEEDRVKHSPPLLEMTGRLRRDAYRYLAHSINSECLAKADMNTNSNAVVQVLYFFSFRADHWDNPLLQAALPEGSAFRFTSPPPPPPPVSMIKMVLGLLTSQKIDLATASDALISRFLKCYLLRPRNRDFICVDPSTNELSSKCEGYENELQYDCLSPENFTLKNHILGLTKPMYFRPPMTWVDPCSNAAFPIFSGPDESVLESGSNDEWLKVRPEMDLTVLTPEDISNWQEGVKTIAQHFASPEFWNQLGQTFLNYHRCSSRTAMERLKQVIFMVLLSFGPRPYLRRVEDFLMSLLQPALRQEQFDGIAEFVGPTMVTEILQKLALSSRSWTREMRLQLYGRVIPRLIVCSEAAAQLASTHPFHECPSAGLKHVEVFKPLLAEGLGNAPPSPPPESSSTSPDDVKNSQADLLANKILFDNWTPDEDYTAEERDMPSDIIKLPDPAGPKARITSPLAEFFKSLYIDSLIVVYSSYIWKFICELASDDNEVDLPKDGDTKSLVCGHHVPAGDGECPVCLGRRLFPRLNQRRAIKDQMMLRLAHVQFWDLLHLLKHFVDSNLGSWEKRLCGNSLWTRQFAASFTRTLTSAGFYKFRNYEPATLRLYPSDNRADSKCLELSEHQIHSILESKLISRLANFEAPELRTMALVGPEFFMRRYLPLLVRDWMSVLLLKGFLPSEASFALQDHLISIAIERLTPATKDLLNCSQRTKFLVAKQIAFRLHCLMYLLVDNVWSAYPMNTLPDSPSESTFEIFYRLAPLLADYAASSDYFWTAELPKKQATLDRCIGKLFYRIGELAVMGHTNSDLVMTQANRMLDFFDVFLLHNEWKTRIFGLILMKLIICHVSAFWKTDDAGETLRTRLKRRLCDLLADPWIDVAQKASNTLTYALQLSVFQYDEQWFKQLAKQSRHKLINPRDGPYSKQEKEAAMLRRHAGVLGLCSIVRAHPHDTPDYLPAVIAEVADHSADPHPIAKSVSDTLMEYSRSHTDQWATQDRAKFSEEQLEAYMSVVSGVSYYV
ncbi:hypothetical protein Aperf_G00000027912 [Anoplocephala perfoliata]